LTPLLWLLSCVAGLFLDSKGAALLCRIFAEAPLTSTHLSYAVVCAEMMSSMVFIRCLKLHAAHGGGSVSQGGLPEAVSGRLIPAVVSVLQRPGATGTIVARFAIKALSSLVVMVGDDCRPRTAKAFCRALAIAPRALEAFAAELAPLSSAPPPPPAEADAFHQTAAYAGASTGRRHPDYRALHARRGRPRGRTRDRARAPAGGVWAAARHRRCTALGAAFRRA
jgi:hypothetical protein